MKIHTKYKVIIYASVKYPQYFFLITITEKEEIADLDSD